MKPYRGVCPPAGDPPHGYVVTVHGPPVSIATACCRPSAAMRSWTGA